MPEVAVIKAKPVPRSGQPRAHLVSPVLHAHFQEGAPHAVGQGQGAEDHPLAASRVGLEVGRDEAGARDHVVVKKQDRLGGRRCRATVTGGRQAPILLGHHAEGGVVHQAVQHFQRPVSRSVHHHDHLGPAGGAHFPEQHRQGACQESATVVGNSPISRASHSLIPKPVLSLKANDQAVSWQVIRLRRS